MSDFFYLIPISLVLGMVGLILFLWSLKNGQYEDLDGASERILYDDDMPSQ
ncbi:cytochrome oxidase maturation protein, cbb3-type [Phyllobacterium sp. YR620]|uniref:cbb3-type cytochrome oxidase assembly protein CcoS n=1 Tax=Phyllobacterium sp. YR620 TaxID=1881066 RepID=UPI0008890EB4|nr:cbb3-type cytochrome oxidase assembly protein CcoS [Phyllobacterium sp. YR620]SDP54785.1 cytochrome oxidase maturation protein, cbb3-type [Phyllobacterium sp. YR620]